MLSIWGGGPHSVLTTLSISLTVSTADKERKSTTEQLPTGMKGSALLSVQLVRSTPPEHSFPSEF